MESTLRCLQMSHIPRNNYWPINSSYPLRPPFRCHLACWSLFCSAVALLPWHLTSSPLPLSGIHAQIGRTPLECECSVQASIIMCRFVFFLPLHLKFLSFPSRILFISALFFVLNSQFSSLPLYQATQLLLILPISKTSNAMHLVSFFFSSSSLSFNKPNFLMQASH